MSANASLTIVGGPTRIEPGRETTLTAQIINLGTVPDDFRLSVREIDPAWITFRPPTVFLQPGGQAKAAIVINPPSGIPAGALRPIFRLLSRRAGNVAIVEIAMPTARAATPPPYQSPARPQAATPPPQPRPTPPPPPAPPPTPAGVAVEPAPDRSPKSPVATQPPVERPQVRAAAPEAPAPDATARATIAPPAPRRGPSPLILGLGAALVLALILVAGAATIITRVGDDGSSAASEPTSVSDPTPTEAPSVAAIATVPPSAPAVVSRTPTAAFVAKRFIVANTGGDGVYLRRTTNLDDRDSAYIDGTPLLQVGPDVQANGLTWRNVRAPDGKAGFIPAQYTQEVP